MPNIDGPSIAPVSGTARQLVVFLHGYGANGADLLSIGEEWRQDLPDAAFAAPNAPDVCEMWSAGFQWFPIRAADGIDAKVLDRKELVSKPAEALNIYLDIQLKKWNVEEKNLVVAGFSQGAMMAMYAMPRRKSPCAGVIGWSGMLLDAPGLKEPGIVKVPVLAIHGDADEVVPAQSLKGVEDGFTAADFDVEVIMRHGLGHGLDHYGLAQSLKFTKKVLGL